MTILILEEMDVEGADDEVNASLQKEAEIFLESLGQGQGKMKLDRMTPLPTLTRLIERGMRRFIWWCLGCPIQGNA